MPEVYKLLNSYYGKNIKWKEVESVLKEAGQMKLMKEYSEPFKNLIITILSQNTSDRNSTRAYLSLRKSFQVKPEVLANANLSRLRKSIKCGGLYNIKSKRIKEVSKLIFDEYGNKFEKILKLPKKELREKLLKIPGVGQKTADVFLAYAAGHDAAPIDVNIERVAKRLGIADKKAKYEEIQKQLGRIFPNNQKARGHQLLIRLGRDFCRAGKASCGKCPVKSVCRKKINYNFI